jgi:hypothetical protein
VAEVTATTTAPEIAPRIQEAIDAGDMVLDDQGGVHLTEQGELRRQNQVLAGIIMQAIAMHRLELAKWKIQRFLEEAITVEPNA